METDVADEAGLGVPPGERMELGGWLRGRMEDFVVEEMPLYQPADEGEHLMVLLEKRGLTTPEAVRRLAHQLGVAPSGAGWAGYKDRYAVCRQWITLPGAAPERALAVELPELRILEARRHKNRLRPGHLAGNRFRLRVRGATPRRQAEAAAHLQRLARAGFPNAFGPQRFGTSGRNAAFGEALVRGLPERLLELAAEPVPGRESPRVTDGRLQLAAGRWKEALGVFPREMALERHLAQAMMRTGDVRAAARGAPRRQRDLLVSAWQSACFNQVLGARLAAAAPAPDGGPRPLLRGDVAMKLENGACFRVPDPAAEEARAARLEIVPTGPLPGRRTMQPEADAGLLEREALAAAGCPVSFEKALVPRSLLRGARRALWIPLREASVQEEESGTYVFSFVLPPGSYATVLMESFGVVETARSEDPPATEDA